MTTNLIGLYSSVMGSGKTALTDTLVEHHGWAQVKFAGTLKGMIREMLTEGLGMSWQEALEHTDGSKKETMIPALGVTCRHLMQTLGTDWGRSLVKPTVWIDLAKAKIQRLLADGWRVVVDDMRFPNEHEAIKALGGATVRVVRPGLIETTGHVSEGALEKHHFDFELRNEHGLEQWQAMASHFHDRLSRQVQAVS